MTCNMTKAKRLQFQTHATALELGKARGQQSTIYALKFSNITLSAQ